MTTLVQHSQTLKAKIESLKEANEIANDLTHIQRRTEEWQTCHSTMMGLRALTAPLTLDTQDAALVEEKTDAFRQNAKTVLSRLREKRDIKALTRDAVWKRLLKSCEGLTAELEAAGCKAWRAYIDEHGSLENSTTLRLRAPPTPSNEDALRVYEDNYAGFTAIAKLKLPRSADDLAMISAHVTSCRQAFADIAFDLPDEVRAFYAAITAGTATLTHVTPTVANWLGEQGHLDRFRIRAISQ